MSISIKQEFSLLLVAEWFNKLLIVACALASGFSFFVMKDVVAQFSVFWLLLIRFGCASLIMLLVFHRRIVVQLNVRMLRTGALLGVLYRLAYVF